jgi:HEAT repeat protein
MEGQIAFLIASMNIIRSSISLIASISDGKINKTVPLHAYDARCRVAMTVLRETGDPDAVNFIRQFVDHPVFFVRWHALRELAKKSPVEALQRLPNFLDREKNPMVKDAAIKMKSYLEYLLDGERHNAD